MILACDGDVRDRFQSVTDGVAVAGGGRPRSAAREVEPVDYSVIPLLLPNPFLPLPTFPLRSFLFFVQLFPVVILSLCFSFSSSFYPSFSFVLPIALYIFIPLDCS